MEENKLHFEEIIQKMVLEHIDSREHKQDIYKALCNMQWQNITNNKIYSCTWRYAGGLIAEAEGNFERMAYCDYYCSGGEGYVEDWVEEYLIQYGWKPLPYEF